MKHGLFLISCMLLLSCQNPEENAAQKTLHRVLGEQASRFVLTEVADSSMVDWFEVQVTDNSVYVEGNSPIALSKGAYSYINNKGYGVVSWEGTNVKIPNELKTEAFPRVTASMPLRMYLNPCTYGYTMTWWDWERWEKELDWMALHGINMPIALLGQEIVWQQVWQEMGIDQSKLEDYYCGPAFLPWFRMGNIYNHLGPLPQNWMEKDKLLQQKIMHRMKELGMRPVVPAFSGHVPPFVAELYPDSKIYELKDWGGLEPEKASYLLDPKDELFTTIGDKFLKKYEEMYGEADLFLADSFNEMLPPVSKENKNAELADYGQAIYASIKNHNPNATWVLQGWTLGHQDYFWTSESTKAFFSKVPKDNLLVLNYAEDNHPIWEKLDAFYGYKWTYGYVHNYGGQQSLFGDLNFYHNQYIELMANPNKGNLVGYGCLPEAIENNTVVYDYIYDVPWGGTNTSVSDWMNMYIINRYGNLSPKAVKAWEIALENTYSIKIWRTTHLGYGTYLHNNRPSLNMNPKMIQGNPETISKVLELLLEDMVFHQDQALYYYDIVDFAKHYAASLADIYLIKASNFYREKNYEQGDLAFEKSKDYLRKLELLQGATIGGSFAQWCEDAISHATTEEEKRLYLRNAKTQITIWGGNRLKDYASKSWSGLLVDFYIPRWEMFFDEVKQQKEGFDEKSIQNKIRKMEEEWTLDTTMPKRMKPISKEAYLEVVKGLIEQR